MGIPGFAEQLDYLKRGEGWVNARDAIIGWAIGIVIKWTKAMQQSQPNGEESHRDDADASEPKY